MIFITIYVIIVEYYNFQYCFPPSRRVDIFEIQLVLSIEIS